ncbi:hypothetical protein CYMTET_6998 [Cymbomonas tetramitiformis]|uniref:Uncharacterized protein n=1 Tax=Cymbomonas tetramitiformis TaxID=36881 RepID=A0AAE0GW37_9CHLO|nr:hypothetical protein CYMTET_42437 [Cymbomonas tetramitiformis]KAK3252927.1 hypothetical protein CYMTET_37798 [Cymbomonas tetramitiformis]KAK3278244.1 hypothetical protein CYMTET_13803 [Cymbomonas tetramitiformis]KAK3285397.1 hypothetical protein CYMTET_6998 [Cymbomonas tetramitiformis]
MVIEPTMQRSDSTETTKSEAIRDSVEIFTKLESEYAELQTKYDKLSKQFQQVTDTNDTLNTQLTAVKSELSEVTEERDALNKANETLMFEIAEKETENTTISEDLTRWKKNARCVTEQHRRLLSKVQPCDFSCDEENSQSEEVVYDGFSQENSS